MSKPRHPHPFEQYPSEHPGWDRKHFVLEGVTWSLLVINREDEQSSMIAAVHGMKQHGGEPWPHYRHMVVDGLLTVDGAVAIILRVFSAWAEGAIRGGEAAQAEVRKAIGL